MMMAITPARGRAANENAVVGKRKDAPRREQPFDRWLHGQLHEIYDAIAQEPLPDDLLELIDRDSGDEGGAPASGSVKPRKESPS
jgi:hypothetical protein